MPTHSPTGVGRRGGNPPKPTEQKRLIGNPGKRPLPDPATVIMLPAAVGVPEAWRPLGKEGAALWRRVWTSGATWLSPGADGELILSMCERLDERMELRALVMSDEGTWRDRGMLRAVEAQIDGCLSAIGFTPTDRARLGVAEVKPASRIEALLQARRAAQ